MGSLRSLLLSFAIWPVVAFSQVASNVTSDQVPRLKGEITVDGNLDEPMWQRAKTLSLDIVTRPFENTPSPVQTDVYIFEDGETLYVGFIAQDPDIDAISAFYRDRDRVWDDDLVGIKLDPFYNQRLAYQFFVNPLGVQLDAIENEMTGDESDSWNAIWESAGKITDNGYIVEMAIPLRTMNFLESDGKKTWGAEFVRFYPRKDRLRISNLPWDRNNSCFLCQMGLLEGFDEARQGNNIAWVPTLVVGAGRERDPFTTEDWTNFDNQEIGLDVKWGITPEVSLQATLNPDFSQVEADVAQVSINNTFALFFPEQRPFFVENADYFSTDQNLVYTRNIGAPDFGAKVTGQIGKHTFGVFAANDVSAQFIVPGNIGSTIAQFDEDTINSALRYRYDVNPDLSLGWISTLRESDNYHNYVNGVDVRYRVTQQDTVEAQYVTSSTQYPETLFRDFCSDDCSQDDDQSEASLRTDEGEEFSGQSWRVTYRHDERDWFARATHFVVDEGFRADLGFENRADFEKSVLGGGYSWWNEGSWWNRVRVRGDWDITHNDNGELLEEELEGYVSVRGIMQSFVEIGFRERDRVGQRFNPGSLAIDGNTDLFNETSYSLFMETRPNPYIYLRNFVRKGDEIDFANNRLGDQLFVESLVDLNIGRHTQLRMRHTYSNLDVNDEVLFIARLSDVRLTYQFDPRQFVRMILTYRNVHRNQANFTFDVDEYSRSFGLQLLYSYKLNPETRFFVGVSSAGVETPELTSLEETQQSVFMKFSYAWLQ